MYEAEISKSVYHFNQYGYKKMFDVLSVRSNRIIKSGQSTTIFESGFCKLL
jgi:hypothetical protein